MEKKSPSNNVVFMALLGVFLMLNTAAAGCAQTPSVLKVDAFKHYIDSFNANDEEIHIQHIPNSRSWEFIKSNIPLFECPDKDFERTFYFRWWTFRKHIKHTEDGFVITEFLPKVKWAGKHNTISCSAGHHYYEARWLHDPKYLDEYSVFWLRKGGSLRRYSFWIADAMWARYLVTGEKDLMVDLLPDLIANYKEWEKTRLEPDGLFWQIDVRDGMEESIGGTGKRATINSYMYGDAVAISKIASLCGRRDIEKEYKAKAEKIKNLVQTRLWDEKAEFFKTMPRDSNSLVDVREILSYTPWYVNMPDAGYESAWKQLMDPNGFYAPYGPTTAEQRNPEFIIAYRGDQCQWNGPSWPFSTTQTLVALANLLNNYSQNVIGTKDYFETLKIYTKCHRLKRDDGKVVPWIDENINPFTGEWLARAILKIKAKRAQDPKKVVKERGKDYNHSGYCDLIISGLVGLRPRTDDTVEVNPLLPADTWEWFCLDNVPYHGRLITIIWDKTGQKYGKGKGLRIFVNGKQIAQSDTLGRITGQLPEDEQGVFDKLL